MSPTNNNGWSFSSQDFSGPNRHSIPMVTLSFVSMNNTPLMRCYYTVNWEALRGGRNLVAWASPEDRETRSFVTGKGQLYSVKN